MPAGVVLDTSFLITLAGQARPDHNITARRYWRCFAELALPIYLPTIVVSEFHIKQEIRPEIVRACVVLPFNWDDAITAASLDFTKVQRGRESRAALKDDVKIIAQAIVKDAAWIITDDASTLYKFALKLKSQGKSKVHPIKLEDGFDESHFDPARQYNMPYEVPQDEPDGDTPSDPGNP
jgi:predicted nucleic acid-binding protein